jgi:hypothetical protein
MSTMRRPGNPWQSGLLTSMLIDHLAIQFMGCYYHEVVTRAA